MAATVAAFQFLVPELFPYLHSVSKVYLYVKTRVVSRNYGCCRLFCFIAYHLLNDQMAVSFLSCDLCTKALPNKPNRDTSQTTLYVFNRCFIHKNHNINHNPVQFPTMHHPNQIKTVKKDYSYMDPQVVQNEPKQGTQSHSHFHNYKFTQLLINEWQILGTMPTKQTRKQSTTI